MTGTSAPSRSSERREVLWPDFDALDTSALVWSTPMGNGLGTDDRLAKTVRHAVATVLSPKQREVVEAYFFEGLSQGEIATRLGIRQQVVHKRIYGATRRGQRVGGALRRLRVALQPFVEP